MSERKKGSTASSGGKGSSSAAAPAGRQSQYFVPGDGIDREVITTDIYRYLGNDALVKPGTHVDKATGRVQDGFYITAYRPPTSAQLADLRADSLKWQREREREKNSTGARGGYPNSLTRQEIWGGNPDELQQPGGGFPAPSYGPMSPPQPPQNPTRGNEFIGRGGGYQPMNTTQQLAPQTSSGSYRQEAYAPAAQPNYTTYPPQQAPMGQVSYSVGMDSSRIDAPRNMPSGAVYPQGVQQAPSVYAPGRAAGSYYAPPPSQPITTGYRTDPSGSYPDPYSRPDSGPPEDDPPQDYYPNDNEMEYDEPSGPAPPQNPPPRRGDRDRERDREHESSRKHRHR